MATLMDCRMTRKGHGLGNARVAELQDGLDERIVRELSKGSTGGWAKYYEVLIRWVLHKNGLDEKDFRAREANRVDAKRDHEVKTGDGIVVDQRHYYGDETTEADILPGARWVIYTPDARTLTCWDDLLDNSWVMTREQFLHTFLLQGQKRHPNLWSGLKKCTDNLSLREQNKSLPRGQKLYDSFQLQPTYHDARVEWLEGSGEALTFREYLEERLEEALDYIEA